MAKGKVTTIPVLSAVWTLFLFTKSDMKSILMPVTLFAAITGPYDSPFRLGLGIVWTWMHLLQFCTANQLLSEDEDTSNKPDRPIPSGRISLTNTYYLRWASVPLCLLYSAFFGPLALAASFALFILTYIYNEMGGHGGHWAVRNVVNGLGLGAFEMGATVITSAHRTSFDQFTLMTLLSSTLLFASTTYAQDFKDINGDRVIGRSTIPIDHPSIARASIMFGLVAWAIALTSYWNVSVPSTCAFCALSWFVGMRFVRYETIKEDQVSFYWYNVWLTWANVVHASDTMFARASHFVFQHPLLILEVGLPCLAMGYLFSQPKSKSEFPPGPRPLPLIGNMLDMPLTYFWKTFYEWGRTYGDVSYVRIFDKQFVILNSSESMRELLEKRGAAYSERPHFVMAGDLIGFDKGIIMAGGETWKKQRKLVQQGLSAEALKEFVPLQEELVQTCLNGIGNNPSNFRSEIRLFISRIITSSTYGYTIRTRDDPILTDVEASLELVNRITAPGACIVDIIPSLRCLPSWLPFLKFHKEAAAGKVLLERAIIQPFNHAKASINSGTAAPSFVSRQLDVELKFDDLSDHEHNLAQAAANLFGAGVDTTGSVIANFLLAMMLHPDMLKRAQDEVDAATGGSRLPSLDDKSALPFMNALISESIRWKLPTPSAVPHRSEIADVYRGWTIPANSVVVPNLWAISQDVPDPDTFRPERFLKGSRVQQASDVRNYAFGIGRRVCPGRYLAESTAFLMIGAILAVFDISKPCDALGNQLPFSLPAYTSGITTAPEDFGCDIKIRPGREGLLNNL